MSPTVWFQVIYLVVVLSLPSHATAMRSIEVVALSGAPVSVAGDVHFDRFDVPLLDAGGRVGFLADFAGPGARGANDAGVVWGHADDLAPIARYGDEVPGLTGVLLDRFEHVNLSSTGAFAAVVSLAGTGTGPGDNAGVLTFEAGTPLQLVARTGTEIPGVQNDEEFAAFFTQPAINEQGMLAFYPAITDARGALSSGLVNSSAPGEALRLVAQAGDPAPGTEPGTTFLAQGFENPFSSRTVVDGLGRTLLHGFLTGPQTATDDAGLWRSRIDGSLELLARVGDPVPDREQTTFLSFAQLPRLNQQGDSTWAAFVNGPSTQLFEVCLFRESGTLETLVCTGESVGNVQLGDVALPNINANGQVSFQGVLVGPGVTPLNELALWVHPADPAADLRLAVRAGDRAPGTEEDVVFRAFSTHVLNADGQLAFTAAVGGPSVSVPNGNVFGIWAERQQGELELVAREGDYLEVAPGDLRQIVQLAFQSNTGNSDGQPTGFNDAGDLAFRATFVDGSSGVFVSRMRAVPEPEIPHLFLFATFMLVLVRQRQDHLHTCFLRGNFK